MSTKFISKAKARERGQPGKEASKARRVAFCTTIFLILTCLVFLGLQIAEISTPGMAWYVYR